MRLVLTNSHPEKSVVVTDVEGSRVVGPDGQTSITIRSPATSTTVFISEGTELPVTASGESTIPDGDGDDGDAGEAEPKNSPDAGGGDPTTPAPNEVREPAEASAA